jgi:hypothetical protein
MSRSEFDDTPDFKNTDFRRHPELDVEDEPGSVSRHGSASGTPPDHAGTGEERLLVEWDRATGEVWYDIMAFSRPHLILTGRGHPYLRRLQERSGKEPAAATLKAVGDITGRASNREEKR